MTPIRTRRWLKQKKKFSKTKMLSLSLSSMCIMRECVSFVEVVYTHTPCVSLSLSHTLLYKAKFSFIKLEPVPRLSFLSSSSFLSEERDLHSPCPALCLFSSAVLSLPIPSESQLISFSLSLLFSSRFISSQQTHNQF